jgi:hypothetical protein
MSVPLQLIDTFLLQYNVGQALLLGYVLVMAGSLPFKSVRVLALNTLVFGVLFLAGPSSAVPFVYKILGIGMLVVAPLLYTIASR